MRAFVEATVRCDRTGRPVLERDPKTGALRKPVWWWFRTEDPFLYSVWWRPDGTKTMEQFLAEQVVLVLEDRVLYGTCTDDVPGRRAVVPIGIYT